MYNNEVTYHDKWNTPENKKALETLHKKYFDRSECAPNCPVGWAPEVLALLDQIDAEFGIRYNESTMRGWYVRGSALADFTYKPILNFFASVKYYLLFPKERFDHWSVAQRVKAVFRDSLSPVRYRMQAIRVQYINKLLNKLIKPKFTLSQVKEKYGTLRIYFSAPDYAEDYIEKLIAETEIKLAIKGCYYPLHTLWGHATINYLDFPTIEAKDNEITRYHHREAMASLKLDLKDIEEKYNEYIKSTQDAP